MASPDSIARQAGCIAIGPASAPKGILIEGAPGTGKSALALNLIDRGAFFVGDDGVLLEREQDRLVARPHPETRGLMEVRNLGLLPFPCIEKAPVALVIVLDPAAPRFVETAETVQIGGVTLPCLRIWPQAHPPALKVELALHRFGLEF